MIKVNLKEVVERKGITIYRLSKMTGIKTQTLYGYANETRYTIDLRNLYKIMRALNINDVGELLIVEDKAS